MNSKLANKLRTYRKEYSLSVRELAKLMNVSPSAVFYYENGKRNPSLKYIYRLHCRLLRLPPREFRNLIKVTGNGPATNSSFVNKKKIPLTWNISRKPTDNSFTYYQK